MLSRWNLVSFSVIMLVHISVFNLIVSTVQKKRHQRLKRFSDSEISLRARRRMTIVVRYSGIDVTVCESTKSHYMLRN